MNKMIEVPEKLYDSLMKLAKEYVSQDNRSTAMPYLFQIRTTEEIVAVEGSGEECWFNSEGDKLRDSDIREIIGRHFGWSESYTRKKIKTLDSWDIDEILENNEYRKINIVEEHRYQNAFFTAKACKQHIESNHYHYNKPVDYLNHSWRNPEMDLISNLLVHLATKTDTKYCVCKIQKKSGGRGFEYRIEPKFIANRWHKKDIIFTGTHLSCTRTVNKCLKLLKQ